MAAQCPLPPISVVITSSSSQKAAPSGLPCLQLKLKPAYLHNHFIGNVTRLLSTNANAYILRHRQKFSTRPVQFMLPTAKKDRAPSEKIPKWSARAIKAFAMAELEARKFKYPNTGTESLLMGILMGTSLAANFLRENGITLFKVREETLKLLGKSYMYFFSPEHPPLTEPAQRALDWAIEEKMKSGVDGEVTTTHLLLGIWSEKDFAGHKIMASLGFDDEKAKELSKYMEEDDVITHRKS